jgi:hypothetical protein
LGVIAREEIARLFVCSGVILVFFGFFSVDLREVKEIRVGKNSKDFERWPDDAKRMENMKCFVVFYGLEFRLKTLSIAGK